MDITNIVKIISARMNTTIARYIYENWQQVYDEPNGVNVLTIFSYDTNAKDLLSKISGLKFDSLISAAFNNNVVNYIIDETGLIDADSFEEYVNRLAIAGIVKERKLGQILLYSFYCYCSRTALLRTKKEYLYDVIRNSSQEICLGILRNFINRLKPNELQEYNLLIPVFIKHTGRHGTNKFDSVLNEFRNEEKNQYASWISDYDIEEAFKGDTNNERKRFWSQFWGLCRSFPDKRHDMLVLDFENFVVVEFNTIGTLYWFDKDAYENIVKKHMHYSTSELKSWLYNNSPNIAMKRHIGYWTNDAYTITSNLMRRR